MKTYVICPVEENKHLNFEGLGEVTPILTGGVTPHMVPSGRDDWKLLEQKIKEGLSEFNPEEDRVVLAGRHATTIALVSFLAKTYPSYTAGVWNNRHKKYFFATHGH